MNFVLILVIPSILLILLNYWVLKINDKEDLGFKTSLIIFIIQLIFNPLLSGYLTLWIYFSLWVGQIVSIIYWTSVFYNSKRIGIIFFLCLILFSFGYIFKNEIESAFFTKENIIDELKCHKILLRDRFTVLEKKVNNDEPKFIRFRVKITKYDYLQLKNRIINSKSYIEDLNINTCNYDSYKDLKYDTINGENEYEYLRTFRTSTKNNNNLKNFVFRLSKTNSTLHYLGTKN